MRVIDAIYFVWVIIITMKIIPATMKIYVIYLEIKSEGTRYVYVNVIKG